MPVTTPEHDAAGPERREREKFFDSNFVHVLRNSSWSIAATFVTAGSLFIEIILLARYLGRDVFGVYLLVLAYPQAVQAILDFRTREAMTRYLGEFVTLRQKEYAVAIVKLLWLIDLLVAAAAFAIVVGTASFVAPHLTEDPNGAHLMQVYALAMVLGAIDNTAGTILQVFRPLRLIIFHQFNIRWRSFGRGHRLDLWRRRAQWSRLGARRGGVHCHSNRRLNSVLSADARAGRQPASADPYAARAA